MTSVIPHNTKGEAVSFTGPVAINVYRAATLHSALGLAKAGIGISRNGPSKTQLLVMATSYTGVKYKRGEYDKARNDLHAIIQTLKANVSHEVMDLHNQDVKSDCPKGWDKVTA